MAILTLIAGIFTLGLAGVVIWANPHRPSNRAFSAILILLGLWLGCVYGAMVEGTAWANNQPSQLIFWLRANAAVAAFFPPLLWLLTTAVLHTRNSERKPSLRPLSIIFAFSAIGAWASTTKSFVYGNPAEAINRGTSYYLYNACSAVAYFACMLNTLKGLRRATGIQKIELQFLVLTAVTIAFTISVLNAVGNYFHTRIPNRAGILILFSGSIFTGWALLFHRVSNVREAFFFLGGRTFILLATATLVWVIFIILESVFFPNIAVAIAAIFAAPIAALLTRLTRYFANAGSDQQLLSVKSQIREMSLTEPELRELTTAFSKLLQTHFNASSAKLVQFDDLTLQIDRTRPGHSTLLELGWATPESLERRRPTASLDDLKDFLAENDAAAALTVPPRSPMPSLLVLIGEKNTGWPFTYSEVERIRDIAELMESVLTRARLMEQAVLQAKMEHLAMMSRGLAHDLKNLITPVSSFLVHTDGRYSPGSAEAEVHAAARRSVRVMGDYVRDALFFSTRLAPKMEPIDLCRLFISVRDVVSNRAQDREVHLLLKESADARLNADHVLLQRMLVNLTSNAIDASRPGGVVSLWAETSRPGWCCLIVQDRGEGIAPENLERIFDPYFTTKQFGDEVRGFGLGLTIADKIARLHGGRIFVGSQPDIGTTMTVELPLTPSTPLSSNLPVTSTTPAKEPILLTGKDQAHAPA